MLSLVPQGGVVGEIGVFEGAFSQQILDVCKPRELVLFDLWPHCDVESGDVDGNNIRTVPGADLEKTVRARFADDRRVRIIKGYSSNIRKFPADSFDAVYIDGDHGYHGVRNDLMDCWRVVKDGGWLLGHDYEINPAKTASTYQFGVQAAVTDFCRDYGESISAFGMDGCVSFAIQVHKGGAVRRAVIGLLTQRTNARNFSVRVWRRLRRLAGFPQ
jgi:hypothetical protein